MLFTFPMLVVIAAAVDNVETSTIPPHDEHAPKTCTCPVPVNARLVIYNRVPKCGSTSMEMYIATASDLNSKFFSERSKDYLHHHLDFNDRQTFAANLSTVSSSYPRLLFDRHVHYLDFESLGIAQPVYINLLRDPVDMYVSAFYFRRFCVCISPSHHVWCEHDWDLRTERFCSGNVNDSPLLSVSSLMGSNNASHLEIHRPGMMTRFLCGHDKECESFTCGPVSLSACGPNPVNDLINMVRRAKQNILDKYVWIGILEDFTGSLSLLSHALPSYFGHMDATKWGAVHMLPEEPKKNRTPLEHMSQKQREREEAREELANKRRELADHPPPTPETLNTLRNMLRSDCEVFRFAKQVYTCRMGACGLKTSLSESVSIVATGCE